MALHRRLVIADHAWRRNRVADAARRRRSAHDLPLRHPERKVRWPLVGEATSTAGGRPLNRNAPTKCRKVAGNLDNRLAGIDWPAGTIRRARLPWRRKTVRLTDVGAVFLFPPMDGPGIHPAPEARKTSRRLGRPARQPAAFTTRLVLRWPRRVSAPRDA